MKTSIHILALGALLALSSACHPTHFRTTATKGQTHTDWNNFYLWGLAGSASIDARALCPNGVAEIKTHASFGQKLLAVFTIGIYSPRTVEVSCAAGSATAVQSPSDTTTVWVALDQDDRAIAIATEHRDGSFERISDREGATR